MASTRPPAEAFYWPEKEIAEGRLPANFKEVLCEYFEEMRKLGHRIMRVVTAAIGARYGPTFDDAGEQCAFDRPMHLLSMLRYDAVSEVDAASIGCGAHTDYGCLTILQIDQEVGGLEVCVDKARADHERRWLPVEPVEGCLVVNAGGALPMNTRTIFMLESACRRTPRRRPLLLCDCALPNLTPSVLCSRAMLFSKSRDVGAME